MSGPTSQYDWLPGVLAEIAEVAGLEAALAVANARGGTAVHIPASPRPGHWLIEAVGDPGTAKAIAKHFSVGRGGVTVVIPLGPAGTLAQHRRRIDRMIGEGKSISEIARAAGYTSRGIERRKARARQVTSSDQKSLF